MRHPFRSKYFSFFQVLMNGGDGVWASVCTEGAAVGHACSCLTVMNLIRMGNTKVLNMYNCQYFRKAAINVTRITTGYDPPIKQPIYGERALDFVFDMGNDKFNLAEFFGEETPMRISTLATPTMIRDRLVTLFGDDDQFTEEIGRKMLEVMLEDLRNNR